ncbi:Crp/Fnr family transcriptional regulator [Ferruginibacter sp. SUN106]|uniref:Crp/Fnr family transcriptional regulator n=1 Tax=Ferruginibacter sp. SUN106 TaxID=2978348 RepID=UPI003D366D65
MILKKHKCDLKSCSLCLSCSKEWLPAIDANRKVFHVKKGELLFKEGDEVKGMFFIHSGLVKVHKRWDEEKEMILRFANKGAIVGHRGLGSDTIYPVSGTALASTEVCFVDMDFFTATLKVNPDYMYELLMFFAAELKESEKRMRNLAHMSTKGRIAYALASLHERFGTDADGYLNIVLSRQDLASYTGTTYETLFKMMNEFSAEDILQFAEKKIKVLNLKKLVLVYEDQQ